MISSEFCNTDLSQKTRLSGLSGGEKFDDKFTRFDAIPDHHGQTDRHLTTVNIVLIHSVARLKSDTVTTIEYRRVVKGT